MIVSICIDWLGFIGKTKQAVGNSLLPTAVALGNN